MPIRGNNMGGWAQIHRIPQPGRCTAARSDHKANNWHEE